MVLTLSRMHGAGRRCSIGLRAALFSAVLVAFQTMAIAQTQGPSAPATPENGPAPATKPTPESAPVSDTERAELLKLIKGLQERVEKLEAARASTPNAASDL